MDPVTYCNWSWFAFLIGFIVGLIIMLIIIWILYSSRSWIFTNCSNKKSNTCIISDYYNDPGEAITVEKVKDTDILHIKSERGTDVLAYKQVVRKESEGCIPDSSTQTVIIANPQYCSFVDTDLGITHVGKNLTFGSNTYTLDGGAVVTTNGNCKPFKIKPGTTGIKKLVGKPMTKWDPNTM